MNRQDGSRRHAWWPDEARNVHVPMRLRIGVLISTGLLLAQAWGLGATRVSAAEPSAEALQFFETDVRPVLAENCFKCHGPTKQKGGLRLDSREAVLRGGDTGPAVVPGKHDESLLIEAIHYDGLEMPPGGKLDEAKIAILTRWVEQGAPWPA